MSARSRSMRGKRRLPLLERCEERILLAHTFAIAGGGTVIARDVVTVAGSPQAVAATVGTPVSGQLVAVFTLSGTAGAASLSDATIDWGDGTATSGGTITAGASGPTFNVLGSHTFALAGTFNGNVSIHASDGSTTTLPFTSGAQAPILAAVGVGVTEGQRLNDVVVATLGAAVGGPAPQAGFYTATIDWGDGTARTQAGVRASTDAGGAIQVIASHTYAESGTFPASITVGTTGHPGLVSVVNTIGVTDVPITLTGRLGPGSDTGTSSSDNITYDRTPAFAGTSEPQSVVSLSLQPLNAVGAPAGAAIAAGSAVTNSLGSWRITTGTLANGSYAATLSAVDRNGVTRASLALPTIVIDSVGPQVAGASMSPRTGTVVVQLMDRQTRLDPSSLLNAANYKIIVPHLPKSKAKSISVTSVSAGPAVAPGSPQSVTLTLNGGRRIKNTRFVFEVVSGGIRDVAGNALDGEYTGSFLSGNGTRGGNFRARFVVGARTVRGPLAP